MTAAFPVAPAPGADKLRGGYYTPEPLARFLADWVAGAGPRLLEPSCGDGAILRHLPSTGAVRGVELMRREAERARVAAPHATVDEGDLFARFTAADEGAWDGVAGNPPFIRFGNWTEPARERAFALMRGAGLRPTKLTNAWVPFVVAASLGLRPGGRLGLVVPAELLQVGYASELRAHLVDRFAALTVVTFERLLFDGVLQEVVLLLGVRGMGPASIRVVEVADAAALPPAGELAELPHAPALRHESEKWTKYLLAPDGIAALRTARELPGIVRLGVLADVDVGVVTGRNRFFVLRPSATAAHGLAPYVRPMAGRSAQLRGIRFAGDDLAALEAADAPCHLLAVDDGLALDDHAPLGAYVGAGEAEDVHRGYKCSIRRRWWVVPSTWVPDAFLLRQIHDHPRVIANAAGATSTDTIHRVRLRDPTTITAEALAAASVNSITFAFAEVMGRSYGGGVLELEPREAEGLPFPDPRTVPEGLADEVDTLVRAGDIAAALDLVDRRLLVEALGVDPALLARLRGVWERLRDRRLARGRRTA